MQIVLEHLTMTVQVPGSVLILREYENLAPGHDPVDRGFSRVPHALSHSTSWRADDGRLLLTFVHVLADGSDLPDAWHGTPDEVESLPSACHAIRHLHFLRFTDPEIASQHDLDQFWELARKVADHHYPAVAGLLAEHGLGDGDFVI